MCSHPYTHPSCTSYESRSPAAKCALTASYSDWKSPDRKMFHHSADLLKLSNDCCESSKSLKGGARANLAPTWRYFVSLSHFVCSVWQHVFFNLWTPQRRRLSHANLVHDASFPLSISFLFESEFFLALSDRSFTAQNVALFICFLSESAVKGIAHFAREHETHVPSSSRIPRRIYAH